MSAVVQAGPGTKNIRKHYEELAREGVRGSYLQHNGGDGCLKIFFCRSEPGLDLRPLFCPLCGKATHPAS